eukprot:TRINITY_DN4502_c0_g5_i1.p1 TRINITY_DN4502_c0_g5~~TRINITY_DN4502_c0_g5_i1.p1  ORF type:complete len:657 (-),score=132.18 TRINITY_DN4502_c0_g5_i1:105-2075(-)
MASSDDDSEEYSEAAAEYSDSETEDKKKKKKQKKDKKKDKKGKEKKPKKDKKEKKGKKDKKKKDKKKRERKRRRSDSYSDDYDDYSYESRPRSRRRRRSAPRADYGAYYGAFGGFPAYGHYGAPNAYASFGGRPPMSGGMSYSHVSPEAMRVHMPPGCKMTLEEACEKAGRGSTSGNTAADNEITVRGPDEEKLSDPDRFESFSEIKEFPRDVRDALDKSFPGPSQIQAYTWPLGIRGKDVIGIAATGSGKTLAFLLPAFCEMYDDRIDPGRDGVGLLVLSPTRELAQQIDNEATRFGKQIGIRSVAMYGGSPKPAQLNKYRNGVHCIVACPGRLNDFLEGGQVRLESSCKRLVLDEADRMLDMGFEPQIRKIINKLPRRRHTLFFTATWPKEVRSLASEFLHDPYKIMIGNRDLLKGNQDITQIAKLVDGMNKNDVLVQVLRDAGLQERKSHGRCLVFSATKRGCESISRYLERYFPCASIHGDKDQVQRDQALNGLKDGRLKVLVATDVAARGLDIKGVGLVVNFDPANNAEDYVHRIGRCGRAGAKGFAVTFLTSQDASKAKGIVEVMDRTDQYVDEQLRALAGIAKPGGGPRRRGGGGGGRNRNKGEKGDRDQSASRSRSRGGGGDGKKRSRSPSRAVVNASPSGRSRSLSI